MFLEKGEERKGGEERHLRANAVDELLVFAVERAEVEAFAENADGFEALLRGEVHLLHGLEQRPVDEMVLRDQIPVPCLPCPANREVLDDGVEAQLLPEPRFEIEGLDVGLVAVEELDVGQVEEMIDRLVERMVRTEVALHVGVDQISRDLR